MCIIRHGNASERGFLGQIFRQESQFQVRLLLILSVAVSVLSWSYYSLFYVNVNINGTDAFIYNWVPVIFYSLSIVYLGLRLFLPPGLLLQPSGDESARQRTGLDRALHNIDRRQCLSDPQ